MAAPAEELPPEQELSEPLMDLTNLARTVDGAGFAYLSLSCVNKRINPIKCVEMYTHLQKIDLSQNAIKDVAPLKSLQFVLSLNLSSNEISTLKGWDGVEGLFPQLRDLDLSSNLLTALLPLPFPALRRLNLACNEIATCAEFTGHEKLTSLDLSENKLTSLAGVANMPALTSLNLSGGIRKELPTNQLDNFEGLAGLEALQELNLARNKFSALQGAWETFPALRAINISENVIEIPAAVAGEKAPEHPLNVLRQLPRLRELQVAGNPFAAPEEPPEGFNLRAEVLVRHWRLTSIDGQPVTDAELEAARLLNISMLEQERDRLKAEAEAAAAAEGGES
jgi:Leucine-rich repeat (LRR) protein